MDFHLTREQEMVRKMYREFAENEVKPLAEELDEEERFPMETVEKMAKLGMMGIYFPKEYGGAGLDAISYAIAVEELARVDPETAARLHPNDHKRIVRALEVFRSTGRTISQHDRETRALPPRYDALTIGLTFRERDDLWARIDQRVDQMARDGLEAEVRGLLSSGLPRTCTAMQAIGYKEFVAAVDGQISWKEAEELVKLRSRQYAKRQLTWFRREKDVIWLNKPDFDYDEEKILSNMLDRWNEIVSADAKEEGEQSC